MYASWPGAKALGAGYNASRLKQIVQKLQLKQLWKAALTKIQQQQRRFRQGPSHTQRIMGELEQFWRLTLRYPGAMGAMPGMTTNRAGGKVPTGTLILAVKAGAHGAPILALYKKVAKQLQRSQIGRGMPAPAPAPPPQATVQHVVFHTVFAVHGRMTAIAYQSHGCVVLQISAPGEPAGHKLLSPGATHSLATAPRFENALKQVHPDNALVLFTQRTPAMAQIEHLTLQQMQTGPGRRLTPGQMKAVKELGLWQTSQFAWTMGFDGKDVRFDAFLRTRKSSHILAGLRGPVLTKAVLGLAPATAGNLQIDSLNFGVLTQNGDGRSARSPATRKQPNRKRQLDCNSSPRKPWCGVGNCAEKGGPGRRQKNLGQGSRAQHRASDSGDYAWPSPQLS